MIMGETGTRANLIIFDEVDTTYVPNAADNRPRPPHLNRKERRKNKATQKVVSPRRR